MHPEMQYLNTLRDILDVAKEHENRTGVNTYRILGVMHKYDFKHGFPLFTTKKTWFKGIKTELLWFLKGSDNIKYLVENGVNIWTDDAYRWYKTRVSSGIVNKDVFIESVKLGTKECNYTFGDLGPVYGVQWRAWGKKHPLNRHDQIYSLIEGLKENPSSRRHIISAWNVDDIPNCALPPCHIMAQFTIDEGKLWCHMYQRSCDMPLGVPFNVASYSLLTHMIAHVTDLKPGGFIWTGHDCHIYHNQIDGIKEQLTREPLPFPELWLNPDVKNIDDFTLDDIKIKNYKHHEKISMPLSTGL